MVPVIGMLLSVDEALAVIDPDANEDWSVIGHHRWGSRACSATTQSVVRRVTSTVCNSPLGASVVSPQLDTASLQGVRRGFVRGLDDLVFQYRIIVGPATADKKDTV